MKKSRLGQNFLFDKSILVRIAACAGLQKEDTVVEIGPGPGTLTRVLSEKVSRLIAIELDETLYKKLKSDLAGYRNIELIRGDAMKFDFGSVGKFKVVSNIPYYITTPLIFRLIEARQLLESMTLTIQKEVAERIVARPGKKDYGVLSIMVQYYSKPELKFIIPKEAFNPVPKVDSSVIRIEILAAPSVRVQDEGLFFRVVKAAFSQRRKTLGNSLKNLRPDIKDVLKNCGIDPGARPETLSSTEFGTLSDFLISSGPE